jgi:hypothetical protein
MNMRILLIQLFYSLQQLFTYTKSNNSRLTAKETLNKLHEMHFDS